jgi:ribosomal-protein-alanine N-acetyltransferase
MATGRSCVRPPSADEPAVVWDARPPPAELATLDAACFGEPWDVATYVETLEHPDWRLWVLRLRTPRVSVGWAACQRLDEEAEIVRIGVAPGLRERGWGKRLLAGVMARLTKDKVRRVFLDVREGNRPALALYEGAGFREVRRHVNFYENPPEDAVILARDLRRRLSISILSIPPVGRRILGR